MSKIDSGLERFRFSPPMSLQVQQVIAATWMGNSMIDYLLYIPLTDIPDGGAWVDVVHATNLPNMISGGASRKDDQLRDFQLMGYYTEGGSLVEQDTGWKLEDVGGGNLYVTDDESEVPVVPIGIILRIGRRPAKLSERDDTVSLGNGSYTLRNDPNVHLMDLEERVAGIDPADHEGIQQGIVEAMRGCIDHRGRTVVDASFEASPSMTEEDLESTLTGKFAQTEKHLVQCREDWGKGDAKEAD